MSIADKISELFQDDIKSAIEQTLSIEDSLSKHLAASIFSRLQASWGGKDVYIPVRDISARNQSIKIAFNGRNHAEICKQFNISMSHLYRIIK